MGHVRRLKVTPALSGTAADARPSGGGVNARLGTASPSVQAHPSGPEGDGRGGGRAGQGQQRSREVQQNRGALRGRE